MNSHSQPASGSNWNLEGTQPISNKAMGPVSQRPKQQQQQKILRHHRESYGVGKDGGEIIAVEGGHIVRSITRKDRHSKVCTAKGPRDRRVRLSAQTAIKFYDVQDRLGYDRPSKAVDWLMKNAKTAIDQLANLPPWDPHKEPTPAAPTADVKTSADSTRDEFYDSVDINNNGLHAQDLRLSLQSFQTSADEDQVAFFSNSSHASPLLFDANPSLSWRNTGEEFGLIPQQQLSYSFFPQRGSLQSSDTQPNPASPVWAGFASGGFSAGFQIPARIRGDCEEDHGPLHHHHHSC